MKDKKLSQLMALMIIIFGLSACQKQFQNVKIYTSTNYPASEPTIIISNKNTNDIVGASILNNVHYSSDAGISWQTQELTSPLGVYGDPCMVVDTNGHFYFFHLGDPGNKGWSSDKILESIIVQKSTDKGKTWSVGKEIGKNPPKDQDKEWAVVDPKTNFLYVTWTEFDKYADPSEDCYSRIQFSKSMDAGETWSKAKTISAVLGNCIDDDLTVEGAVPAVGPAGEIYVSWSYDDYIYFNKSTDGGETWEAKEKRIAEQVGGWDMKVEGVGRANGMPITVVDLSQSENNGHIYICFGDKSGGEKNSNIFVIQSNDKGNTWSSKKIIHPDKNKREQFFPWLCIDQSNGNLYVVYYDREKQNDWWTDVSLASSKNGGLSWKNNIISKKPFKTPGEKVFFGDYNNISAANGIVRPIWTRADGNILSIYTAIINK